MFKQGLLAVVFCIGLLPAVSGAVQITLEGHTYIISTTDVSSFTDFQTTAAAQPWWGDRDMARSAADQVGPALGFPNFIGEEGPWFAFEFPSLISGDGFVELFALDVDGSSPGPIIQEIGTTGVWAVAEKVAVPLPAPVALLLAGLAGIGYSRKRFSQVERV